MDIVAHYVIEKLGEALHDAESTIGQQQQRIKELEAELKAVTEDKKGEMKLPGTDPRN